jgi:hypothetical protein
MGWIDPNSNEERAKLARTVIALANHGGGTLFIGYEEREGTWQENTQLTGGVLTAERVNEIIEEFADPAFRCEFQLVRHERLALPHPIVVVPGEHRVPVRARRDVDGYILQDAYYLRRLDAQGSPVSEPPHTSAEWNELIHRCVIAERDALLDNLRAALLGERSRMSPETVEERGARWEAGSFERFRELIAKKGAGETYARGYYSCAYVFGDEVDVGTRRLLDALRSVEHQTGWPVWIMFDREPIRPYPMDGTIECHVYEADSAREPAHSDFWRASPDGQFFLLRGFQEDEVENLKGKAEPGAAFDRHLPFWRVGECLLHAARMAERLDLPTTTVHFRFQWVGLAGRQLTNLFGHWPPGHATGTSKQNVVRSEVTVDADRVRLQLADLVATLVRPLFEVFDFAEPRRAEVEQALTEMLKRTGGA